MRLADSARVAYLCDNFKYYMPIMSPDNYEHDLWVTGSIRDDPRKRLKYNFSRSVKQAIELTLEAFRIDW